VLSQRGIRVADTLAASATGMTRPELMRVTGMSQPTLHRALADLRQEGLIDTVSGDRPGGVMRLGRGAGMAVAVDVGRAHRAAVAVDAHGTMLTKPVNNDMSATPDACGPEMLTAIADLIVAAVRSAGKEAAERGEAPCSLGDVRAIGVGIPFPVSPHGMTVGTFAAQLSGLPLAKVLRGQVAERAGREGVALHPKLRIRFAKDGDLGVMALWRDRMHAHLHEQDGGANPLQESLMYLKASYGLDAGIICHGMLVAGGRGLAGQVGHMWLPSMEEPLRSEIYGAGRRGQRDPSDGKHLLEWPHERCPRCDRLNCLENLASGRAILRDLRYTPHDRQPVSVQELVECVCTQQTERPDVHRAVVRSASMIGVTLADAVRLADPTRIFVGGLLAKARETVMTPLRIAFAKAGLPGLEPEVIAIDHDRVTRLELEGAAALALKSMERRWQGGHDTPDLAPP
jgi:predicted NBD/HSP70 family sugar kinase